MTDTTTAPAVTTAEGGKSLDVLDPSTGRTLLSIADASPADGIRALALGTGMMGFNIGVLWNAAAPFGGVKQSGIGREGGAEGIHEYLSTKYTLIPNE